MPSLTIHVTDQDIADAWDLAPRNDIPVADRCPVALAATREIGTPIRVDTPEDKVPPNKMRMHWKARGFDHSRDVWLPDEVVERVNTYDLNGIMWPFEFTVEIPE